MKTMNLINLSINFKILLIIILSIMICSNNSIHLRITSLQDGNNSAQNTDQTSSSSNESAKNEISGKSAGYGSWGHSSYGGGSCGCPQTHPNYYERKCYQNCKQGCRFQNFIKPECRHCKGREDYTPESIRNQCK